MDKIDIIKKGFVFLKEDCSQVWLCGFVNKTEIPEKATKEAYEDGCFTHEFNDTKTDGYDEASFYGSIYLPFYDDIYLKFEVYA
jgi:hypothetical protein